MENETDEQRKESDRLRKRKLGDWRKILSTKEGRRLTWSLLAETGLFRSSFTANSNQTSFLEGQRDIGLGILRFVNEADSAAFAQMQREFMSEQPKKENLENGEYS